MNRPTSVFLISTAVLRWRWLRWPERGAELLIPLLLRGVLGAVAFAFAVAFALAGAGRVAAVDVASALPVGLCLWGGGNQLL